MLHAAFLSVFACTCFLLVISFITVLDPLAQTVIRLARESYCGCNPAMRQDFYGTRFSYEKAVNDNP